MRILLVPFFLFLFSGISCAQLLAQTSEKRFRQSQVFDSTYGICRYEKLNFALGGDSVRHDKKGYACQGWLEDLSENGQVMHKGYYVDGQLKVYKNYYENGQLERSFKVTSINGCNMQVFYADGKIKSDVDYYKGNPQKWSDYYANGQLSYYEENQKNMEYVIQRKSFFENGKPESLFEMTDHKTKKYLKTEYFENGKIKETGEMRFNPNSFDYQKDGPWKAYDENGKLISEDIYVNGEMNVRSN
jgi:antitoxin component YwqK of YwqJK toxin-antitoxin module